LVWVHPALACRPQQVLLCRLLLRLLQPRQIWQRGHWGGTLQHMLLLLWRLWWRLLLGHEAAVWQTAAATTQQRWPAG
jgi:hypothetical protein